eukprot:GHVU01041343.1.p1 GENE.GHVU01041343.1~~GHVU01041343.1.p1  ORF type:complete len:132 (+),score=10.65 GHVU01041343.1:99-494(+)
MFFTPVLQHAVSPRPVGLVLLDIAPEVRFLPSMINDRGVLRAAVPALVRYKVDDHSSINQTTTGWCLCSLLLFAASVLASVATLASSIAAAVCAAVASHPPPPPPLFLRQHALQTLAGQPLETVPSVAPAR